MKKRLLCAIVASVIMTALGLAASAAAYYEPYVLCYNSTHSGAHEGIQSGWKLDNRGGSLRTSILGNYNNFSDTSNMRASALIRDLNKTSEGVVTFKTAFRITEGLDGFGMNFIDENKKDVYALWISDGKFVTLQPDGSYRTLCAVPSTYAETYIKVMVKMDFEKKTALTVIDDVAYGTDSLLSDNIMRFAYRTTPEDKVSVVLHGYTKITANYYLHEDFTFNNKVENQVPYGWTSSDTANAYVTRAEGYAGNDGSLSKSFDAVGGKLAFEGFLRSDGGTGSLSVFGGNDTAFDVSFDGTDFKTLGATVYTNYLKSFWYRFRIEADLDKHTAVVKINGRKVADVSLPQNITSVDSIKITASECVYFDDIKLFSLVEHDDYVSEPVLPSEDEYTVGINVCSLWAYTSNHGWSCSSPYEEIRPVLGYYDEGSPEVADWEIKMMTEHGIDFQAFCWYADNSNAPIKSPRNSLQLHDGYMNARYSDKMKYCIIWEAANAGRPYSSEAFRNYFVPYWIEHYLKDSRYMTIDNKPVFMIFGIRYVFESLGSAEIVREEFDYFREEVKKLGFDDLLIIVSNTKPTSEFETAGIDGSYAYNWSTAGYDPAVAIKGNTEWADAAAKYNTWMVPTLSTGFNSLPWHGKRYPNMTVSDYKYGLEWMRDTYFEKYPAKEDWQKDFYMLSTWNEYGEGTYVMPAEKLNGFGYLETIRQVLTNADNSTHKDIIPTDAQLERIGKNYPQHVRLLRRHDNYTPDVPKTMYSEYKVVFDGETHFKTGNVTNAVYDGAVGGTSSSELAYAETRDILGFDTIDTKYLKVVMSVSEAGTAKLYYSTREYPGYAKTHVVTFPVTADENTYYVPFSEAGIVDGIRIMPAEKAGVSFTVESVEFMEQRKLFIDEKWIESLVYPERIGNNIYFAFDPAQCEENILGIHYEWDYGTKTLSLYGADGDDEYVHYTVGSKTVKTSNGNYTMADAVYLSDGLPMIDMEILCDVLGMDCEFRGDDLYIETSNYDMHSKYLTMDDYEWDFTLGNELGCTVANAETDIKGGAFHIVGTDNDIRMTIPTLMFKAEQYTKMEILMKYSSTRGANGDWINVFFSRTTDSALDGVNRFLKCDFDTLNSGDEYVKFVIDLAECPNWNGTIEVLRVDPIQGKGSECYIKYIKLIEDENYSTRNYKSRDVFTSASYNADDGVKPFANYSGIKVSVVDDPVSDVDGDNAYKVEYVSGSRYVGADIPMMYEPGAKYTVSYKAMLGEVGLIDTQPVVNISSHGDVKYDDPDRYSLTSNKDDHIGSGKQLPVNGTEWVDFSYTFTVNAKSFIRGTDAYRIYVNPYVQSGSSAQHPIVLYLDDISITKVTDTEPAVTSATVSGGTVSVSGTTTVKYPADRNVYVAIYDKDGRFMGMKLANASDSAEISAEFENASDATHAKIFTWSGLKSFRPVFADIETEISK